MYLPYRFTYHFIRVHENLVQHPRNYISISKIKERERKVTKPFLNPKAKENHKIFLSNFCLFLNSIDI